MRANLCAALHSIVSLLPHTSHQMQANLSENINKGYMVSVKHLRDMLMAYEWDLHGKELAGRK